MNANELSAPIKTVSIETVQANTMQPDFAEMRDLQVGEMQYVGGGDIFVGTR